MGALAVSLVIRWEVGKDIGFRTDPHMGLGLRVEGLGFKLRVEGLGYRAQGSLGIELTGSLQRSIATASTHQSMTPLLTELFI